MVNQNGGGETGVSTLTSPSKERTLLKRDPKLVTSYAMQRRYDTVDLRAIIAKFNCIPMESCEAKWQCNGDCAAIIASNVNIE